MDEAAAALCYACAVADGLRRLLVGLPAGPARPPPGSDGHQRAFAFAQPPP